MPYSPFLSLTLNQTLKQANNMANTIVKIEEQKTNGDWCNIKTEGGREVSINLKSAVKVAEQIAAGAKEIEMNIVEKNGKFYGWDKQEQKQGGGFKQLTPEQIAAKQQREDHIQRMIIAQSSLSAAVQYYQQREGTVEKVKVLALEFYNLVVNMSKNEQ